MGFTTLSRKIPKRVQNVKTIKFQFNIILFVIDFYF